MRSFFASWNGRIGRLQWWLRTIGVSVAGYLVLLSVMIAYVPPEGGEISWIKDVAPTPSGAVISIIWLAVFGYMLSAIAVKRLNDRDRPHWLLAVYWTPFVYSIISEAAAFAMGLLGALIDVLLLALTVWIMVELGFLRGTPGPNRHGPDPLATGGVVAA